MLGNVIYKLQSSQLAFELTTLCALIVPDPKRVLKSARFLCISIYNLYFSQFHLTLSNFKSLLCDFF